MAVALLALLSVGLVLLGADLFVSQNLALAASLVDASSGLSVWIIFEVLASLTALFSVVITMFYFIGTGKAVKESVRDHDLDEGYYDLVLKYKKRYFPAMTLALLFYIALPGVGAAVTVDYVGRTTHFLVALSTVLMHLYVCWRGWEYIIENDRLVATVDRLVRERQQERETEA